MTAKIFKLQGLVIDKRDRGEKDIIFTILTVQDTKVDVLAKHAKKVPSRHNSGLELFNGVDCQLYHGRFLPVVNQSRQTLCFPHVVTEYAKLKSAYTMMSLIKNLLAPQQTQPHLFELLHSGLTLLDHCYPEDREIITLAFKLKLLTMLGILRVSETCDQCGKKFSELVNFCQYRLLCSDCSFRPEITFEESINQYLCRLNTHGFEQIVQEELPRQRAQILHSVLNDFTLLQYPFQRYQVIW